MRPRCLSCRARAAGPARAGASDRTGVAHGHRVCDEAGEHQPRAVPATSGACRSRALFSGTPGAGACPAPQGRGALGEAARARVEPVPRRLPARPLPRVLLPRTVRAAAVCPSSTRAVRRLPCGCTAAARGARGRNWHREPCLGGASRGAPTARCAEARAAARRRSEGPSARLWRARRARGAGARRVRRRLGILADRRRLSDLHGCRHLKNLDGLTIRMLQSGASPDTARMMAWIEQVRNAAPTAMTNSEALDQLCRGAPRRR